MTTANGYISRDELMALWRSVTDEAYWKALVESEDSLIESIEQAAAQYEALSIAIRDLFGSYYIRRWSGETSPPATLGRRAEVVVEFSRALALDLPLFVSEFVVEQQLTDYSPDGPLLVKTGRRYALESPALLVPGATAVQRTARAVANGAGYNRAEPGTVTGYDKPVTDGLANSFAVLTAGVDTHTLTCWLEPDVIPPAAVGMYVQLTSGANVGRYARIIGYTAPDYGVTGPTVILAAEALFATTSEVGTFEVGESVTLGSGVGTVLAVAEHYLYVSRVAGSFAAGTVTGSTSGATATATVAWSSDLTSDPSVSWRLVTWSMFGFEVTNPAKPSGGQYGWLEEFGSERDVIYRDGETEEQFRARVAKLPDTVSPNAIVRAVNRVLAPVGESACFRETETELLPGMFFDAGGSSDPVQHPEVNFAFDMTSDEDRFKVLLSLEEFRGFFLVGVPEFPGEWFASSFDDGLSPELFALDAAAMVDGFEAVPDSRDIYGAVYDAILKTKAGGVAFDLYVESLGCF